MSHNKIKSLKLQRHNQSWMKLEDNSIVLGDEINSSMERVEKSVRSQESLTPVHSTPKRSSGNPSNTHDQSTTLDNRVSPILLPCTQEAGNEVAWDWQSPLTKSTAARRARNNGDSIGTPKRTRFLQKKRNSHSPLLYNPIKRKLINNDNQKEDLDKFTAEMKAHMEQLKTVAKDDEGRSTKNVNVDTNVSNNQSLIDIDIDDFAECEAKVDFTISDESTSCKKIETNVSKTSLDDFFDDSIEDSMVKCSQEVEEKLRLESCRENSEKTNSSSSSSKVKDFSWHQQSYTSFLATKEKSRDRSSANSSKITPGTSTKNSSSACGFQPVTHDPKKSNTTTTKNSNSTITRLTNEVKKSNVASATSWISSKSSSSSSSSRNNNNVPFSKPSIKNNEVTTKKETFEIPDDSFDDDFFAVGLDDLVDSTLEKINPIEQSSSNDKNDNNQSVNRYGRVYVSPHGALPKDNNPRSTVVSTAKRVILPPPSQASSTNQRFDTLLGNFSNKSKFIPRSTSNDNLEPLKNTIMPGSQSTAASTIQARKFFKTKSLSTSSFDDSSSDTKNINASSSKVPKNDNFKYGNSSSSVSTEQQRQTIKPNPNRCENNAWPRINGNHDNTRISNFDRNGRREDGKKSGRLMISQSNEKQNGVKETATGSQWICTPEEIERKRLEAKMKLEMKRKLQARSKSAGLLSTGTNHGPVKR